MSWTDTYDGIFFLSLASLLVGVCGLSIKYCLKSKCEHFALCCGLISIDRRVDLEVQEEMKKIEMGVDTKDDDDDEEGKAGMTLDLSKMGMRKK
jgi:hypothetical protein